MLALAIVAARLIPDLQTYPAEWRISTGTFWSRVVEWINVNYFDTLEAIKNALLLNLLIPFKRFSSACPGPASSPVWPSPGGGWAGSGWRCWPGRCRS